MMVRAERVVTTELVADAYRFIEDVQLGRRRDYDEGYVESFDEAFELSLPPGYPEGEQVFRGREGLKRWIGGITEIWAEWRMEQERFIVAGDQVVVLVRVVARGHRSGVSLDRETAHIWSIAGDRVSRCEVYFDRAEALEEAAGS